MKTNPTDLTPRDCECKGNCGGGRRGLIPVTKPAEASVFGAQDGRSDPDGARQSAIAKKAAGMPESRRAGYLKATRGKASPRAAIKAQCLECVGWNRAEVICCTGWACPLWKYRPFTEDGGEDASPGRS